MTELTQQNNELTQPSGALDLAEAAEAGLTRVGTRPPLLGYVRDVWQRRIFAFALAKAKLQAEGQTNRLGFAWLVITPLLDAAVYGTVFGMLQGSNRPDHFIQFLLIGIFLFRYFSDCVSKGASAIISNRALVQSLSFPRMVLPFSVLIEHTLRFVPVLVVLFIINIAMGSRPDVTWLLIPLVIAMLVFFNAGVILFMARIAVHFRDIRQVIPFFNRFMRYFSGVFYDPVRFVGNMPGVMLLFTLDPLYDYMEMLRAIFIPGYTVSTTIIVSGVVWSVVAFVGGLVFFWTAEARYGRAD